MLQRLDTEPASNLHRSICIAMPTKRAQKSSSSTETTQKSRKRAVSARAAADARMENLGEAARSELAAVLGRNVDDMPRIRKTDDVPTKYSVIDVIMLVKGSSAENAAREFRLLCERYGDGCQKVTAIRFRDSIGRLSRNASPAATLENVVEVVLLLTGSHAARIRHKVPKLLQARRNITMA